MLPCSVLEPHTSQLELCPGCIWEPVKKQVPEKSHSVSFSSMGADFLVQISTQQSTPSGGVKTQSPAAIDGVEGNSCVTVKGLEDKGLALWRELGLPYLKV